MVIEKYYSQSKKYQTDDTSYQLFKICEYLSTKQYKLTRFHSSFISENYKVVCSTKYNVDIRLEDIKAFIRETSCVNDKSFAVEAFKDRQIVSVSCREFNENAITIEIRSNNNAVDAKNSIKAAFQELEQDKEELKLRLFPDRKNIIEKLYRKEKKYRLENFTSQLSELCNYLSTKQYNFTRLSGTFKNDECNIDRRVRNIAELEITDIELFINEASLAENRHLTIEASKDGLTIEVSCRESDKYVMQEDTITIKIKIDSNTEHIESKFEKLFEELESEDIKPKLHPILNSTDRIRNESFVSVGRTFLAQKDVNDEWINQAIANVKNLISDTVSFSGSYKYYNPEKKTNETIRLKDIDQFKQTISELHYEISSFYISSYSPRLKFSFSCKILTGFLLLNIEEIDVQQIDLIFEQLIEGLDTEPLNKTLYRGNKLERKYVLSNSITRYNFRNVVEAAIKEAFNGSRYALQKCSINKGLGDKDDFVTYEKFIEKLNNNNHLASAAIAVEGINGHEVDISIDLEAEPKILSITNIKSKVETSENVEELDRIDKAVRNVLENKTQLQVLYLKNLQTGEVINNANKRYGLDDFLSKLNPKDIFKAILGGLSAVAVAIVGVGGGLEFANNSLNPEYKILINKPYQEQIENSPNNLNINWYLCRKRNNAPRAENTIKNAKIEAILFREKPNRFKFETKEMNKLQVIKYKNENITPGSYTLRLAIFDDNEGEKGNYYKGIEPKEVSFRMLEGGELKFDGQLEHLDCSSLFSVENKGSDNSDSES